MKRNIISLILLGIFLFNQWICYADGSDGKDKIRELYINQFFKQVLEFDKKAKEIEKLSEGKVHLAAYIDLDTVEDGEYYLIHVFEDHEDHIATLWWFRINIKTFIVQYWSIIDGNFYSLEEWRRNPDRF